MKKHFKLIGLVTIFVTGLAFADGPPPFFKETLPEHAIAKMLESYGVLQGEGAALDPKTRELIALAVAAQIPCEYCVYAHRKNAKGHGASEAELREAAATAGYVRMWSTVFQAAAYDLDEFKADHDKLTGTSD